MSNDGNLLDSFSSSELIAVLLVVGEHEFGRYSKDRCAKDRFRDFGVSNKRH